MYLLLNKLKNLLPEILVFLLLIGMRIPDLGRDTFNTDVWKWKNRTYDFLNAVTSANAEGTYQTYHPGVTLMALGGAGTLTYNASYKLTHRGIKPPDGNQTILGVHTFQKIAVALAISTLLTYTFWILRGLHGLIFPAVFTLLLNTEPFFIAHTREFHLEGLVTAFMLASFVSLYKFLVTFEEGSAFRVRRTFVLSAIFASLTILTKSSGLFIVPFNLMVLVCLLGLKKFSVKDILKIGSIWTALFVLIFVMAWPSMWVQPIYTLQRYFGGVQEVGLEGDHLQLYFGKYVENPGPFFYLLNIILRVTPEMLLVFMGSTALLILGIKKKFSTKALLSICVLYSALFLIYLSIPTKKLDRYIIPMFPFVIMGASIYIKLILDLARSSSSVIKRRVAYGVLSLFLLFRVIQLAYYHPSYLFYYTPVIGAKEAIGIVEPKWAFAAPLVASHFESMGGQKFNVVFPEKYYTQMYPFFTTKGTGILDKKEDALKAKYFVYPVWEDLSGQSKYKIKFSETIKLKGVALYNVYEKY